MPGASLDFDFWINRYNASLDSVIGNKWFNGFIFNVMDTNRLFGKRGEEVIGPSVSPRLTTAGPTQTFPAATLGGSVGGGFENPDYWSIRDDVSVFFEKGGQHNLKFGGYVERAKLAGFFLAGTNGNFVYDRNPPEPRRLAVPRRTRASGTLLNFLPRFATRRTSASPASTPNRISGPATFRTIGPSEAELTLNLGLRYDLETGSLENSGGDTFLQPEFSDDKDNFQPRLGFAYDVKGDGNTILRGGAGVFYSQAFLNIALLVQRSNRPQEINVTVLNEDGDIGFNTDPLDGRTFEDFQDQIGTVPVDVTIYPEGTEIPNLWSYSIGVAHQLTPTIAIEADYVHQRSDNQFKSVDTNLFYDQANDRALPVRSGNFVELGGQVTGVGRPDPAFNQIWEVQNAASARYHGLSLAVTKRFTNRLSFGGTYLLSKNEDSTDDFDSFPSNNFDLEDEFGTSLNDQRHRFTSNWVWEMPYNFVFSGLVYGASGTARRTVANGLDLFSTAPQPRGLLPRPTCGLDPRFSARLRHSRHPGRNAGSEKCIPHRVGVPSRCPHRLESVRHGEGLHRAYVRGVQPLQPEQPGSSGLQHQPRKRRLRQSRPLLEPALSAEAGAARRDHAFLISFQRKGAEKSQRRKEENIDCFSPLRLCVPLRVFALKVI